jgi:hypothetical protein
MTQEDYKHPITPPPELVQQLIKQIYGPENGRLKVRDIEVATFFARWGADQELDGCFEEMNTWGAVTSYGGALADDLRSARRSKPPSSKGPTDEELLELMPETMRDEFAAVSSVYSTSTGGQVEPGFFRVVLNTAALKYARAVLARWGK